jgi:hypothetical protein
MPDKDENLTKTFVINIFGVVLLRDGQKGYYPVLIFTLDEIFLI